MKMLILLLSLCVAGLHISFETRANELSWQQAQITHLHGLGHEVKYGLLKRKNKKQYHLYVSTPKQTKNSSKLYPIIYLLDGGITYPMLSSYHYLLNALKEVPEAIIVGISYGTGDWKQGNNRSVDFTAPSKEREHWGGAEHFLKFLQSELIPQVEKDLPVDKTKRVIFGNSLGGQFGLYAASHAGQTFYGVIASNPAIHTNTNFYLRTPHNIKQNKVKLFIGRAENDAERFKLPLNTWVNHWKKQTDLPWELQIKTIPEHGHVSSVPEAYRLGMQWLFKSHDDK